MPSDAKRNSTQNIELLLSINNLINRFGYSSIIGFEDNYLKKKKKRQSQIHHSSVCVVAHHHSKLPSALKKHLKKDYFTNLSLIHSFSQDVPVFVWPFMYLIYVAPHTSSPGCYGSTAFTSAPSNCRSWYL